MNIINKQKFLAELSRLLTFMYQEDRLEALSLYDNMFDSAVDEHALLQFLYSPTRQAVIIARAYQGASGKLQIESSSRGRSAQEDDGATPSYILAIDELCREAALKGVLNAPVVDKDQLSFFEDEPQSSDVPDDIFDNYDPAGFDGDDTLPELTNDDDAFFPAQSAPVQEPAAEAPLFVEKPAPAVEAAPTISFDELAAVIDERAAEKSMEPSEPVDEPEEPESSEPEEPAEAEEEPEALLPSEADEPEQIAEPEEITAPVVIAEPEDDSAAAEEIPPEPVPVEPVFTEEPDAVEAETQPAADIPEPETEDAVDKFISEFKISDEAPEEAADAEPVEQPLAPAPTEETSADAADFDPVKDDFLSVPAEKMTVRKLRPFILILYIILAIPVGIVGTALLLIPTLLFLAISIGILSVGIMLVTSAFGGLVMFADILLLLGSALVTLALGVLCAWIFLWFIFGAIVGFIRALIALGRKWCYKEVKAA